MFKTIAHLSLIPALLGGSIMARADTSPYFGHWINSEDKPHYSSKGIAYKSIDIAPCGKDFCGVSVSDKGECGAILFRFLTIHAQNDFLEGHGKWGSEKIKIQLARTTDDKNQPSLLIGLGDKTFDFEGREGSLPLYKANYKNVGEAKCHADVGS
jgi:hypothetical protein